MCNEIFIETAEKFKKYTDEETFNRIKEYSTVSEMWKNCIKEYSQTIAIEDNGEKLTFADLEEKVASLRYKLNNLVGTKKRVALIAPNSAAFVVGYLAIVTSSNAAIVLPPQLDEKSVMGCCLLYKASAILFDESMTEKTNLAASKVPALKIEKNEEGALEVVDAQADDECTLMFTSGTTGKNKAAILSNRAVMLGTVNGCYGYKDVFNQRYLLILPFSHVFGLIRNLMTSLYTGSTLFICRDNKNMFHDIAEFKPTILVTVPALAEMALKLSKQFGRNMLGESMKVIIAGAAAVAPYLIDAYNEYGIQVCPGYGLTESANLVSGNPEGLKKLESVGLPYPHQQLKIVNGELWIKGENIMDKYADADAEDPFTDGWFRTGDLVRIDEEGFIYITGRSKEIIVLANGENVSPAEVEMVFNRLAFVQDSQVFEDVTESGTHILALEIVPRDFELKKLNEENVEEVMLEELKKVNESLPSYQRVSKITIRDCDFERSPSMKILRYKKC